MKQTAKTVVGVAVLAAALGMGSQTAFSKPKPKAETLMECSRETVSGALYNRVSGSLLSQTAKIRNAVDATSSETVRVSVSVKVSAAGNAEVTKVMAGKAGSTQQDITSKIELKLDGVALPPSGEGCVSTLWVSIPSE